MCYNSKPGYSIVFICLPMFLHLEDCAFGDLLPHSFIIFKCEVLFSAACFSCENSDSRVCELYSRTTPHLPERKAPGNALVLQCFQPLVFCTSQESYICSLNSCVVQSRALTFTPKFYVFFLREKIIPRPPLASFVSFSSVPRTVVTVLSVPWLTLETSISTFNLLSLFSAFLSTHSC